MVDEREILKQYSYKATSNLVIAHDSRRNKDRDGAGVSAFKIGDLPGRMGDKVNRPGDKSQELKTTIQKLKDRQKTRHHQQQQQQQQQQQSILQSSDERSSDDVVQVAEDLEVNDDGLLYIPSTAVSRHAYQALMAFATSKLGDQPQDLLKGAVDEMLSVLKNEMLMELDKKESIQSVLGPMDSDEFSRLSLLGRQITDYGIDDEEGNVAGRSDDKGSGTDIGVAVTHDADDEDEGGNSNDFDALDNGSDDVVGEVIDLDDDVDEIQQEDHHQLKAKHNEGEGDDEENLENIDLDSVFKPHDTTHIDNHTITTKIDHKEIDAYWIQRQLVQYYPDPVECQDTSKSVMKALSAPYDDRACENKLIDILLFDKFDLLEKLLDNRMLIVWGTKLASTEDSDDLKRLKHEMKQDQRAKHLFKLFFPDDDDDVTNEQQPTDQQQEQQTKIENDNLMVDADNNTSNGASNNKQYKGEGETNEATMKMSNPFGRRRPKFALRTIDLEGIAFQKGSRSTAIRQCKLPDGSEHVEHKEYEEWYIPASRIRSNLLVRSIISINDLPKWARCAFPGTRQLNRVQSTAYECAFESDENMLLCAPTGAGKTNVAMLTILRTIKKLINNGNNSEYDDVLDNNYIDQNVDISEIKVVYIAPMKALVAEVVENLSRRLKDIGMNVKELTGDVSLSRKEIDHTHVIVTTPEKWDIITRKSAEKSFTRLVKLLIVDEIHLLHDERGPVLEAVIARTLRDKELIATPTRVVGLSATLPNYKDVAAFLRVDVQSGLFYFGAEHRPCPLQQCYIGITSKKALKRFQLMNEITYDKVIQQLEKSNQTIIFVHSRKETAATGQFLIDKAINDEVIDKFLKPKSGAFEIIQSELPKLLSKDLSTLLEHGIAIHHAGMARNDRSLVERLFEARHVKVLISTATLAWGVNLPAHSVIIKGTQVYSPEHGRWTQLSSMDVMQMMGRAGRPQYDTFGEGTIITSKSDVLYYLSLLNNQLPIESQVVSRIVDMLNAEIANGSISSINEGSQWLSCTYLYVRMLKNPVLYGVPVEERQADVTLDRRRAELIHSAALELHNGGLVKYNRKSGELIGTDMGKVSADFYVTYQSMILYIERMKQCNSDIDLIRIFASSGEFKYMRVRDEERLELARLAERVPIPIKDGLDEPTAKINVLLQGYISNLSLDGLALRADMVYVTQSAARLSRALLHIALQMKDALLFERCLVLSKCVAARQWSSQSPLRQFQRKLGRDVLRKIERKDYPFERYYDLNVSELGELLKNGKLGKTVHRLVHSLPRLEMDARVRPLSRTIVEVDLTLLPDFRYDYNVHGGGENFWITVEDADSEHLLYAELFFLKGSLATSEHFLTFTLPITTPLPPQYFIRCVSDKWIVPETILPISFQGLVLPDKFSPLTKVSDNEPISVKEVFRPYLQPVDNASKGNDDDDEYALAKREIIADACSYLSDRTYHLSPLQLQVFPCLFESDEPVVLASIPDAERDVCIELGLIRLFSENPAAIAVWIVGQGNKTVQHKMELTTKGIGKALNLTVSAFISDGTEDLSVLKASGSLILTTPEKWDMFTRRRREKRIAKILKKIGLIILDDLHLLSETSEHGAAYEVVASRLRYIAADAEENNKPSFRLLAVSNPIANAKEVGHWLGCPPKNVFSFHPKDVCKDLKLDVVAGSFRSRLKDSRAVMLSKPVYTTIRKYIGERKHQVIVYTSNAKVASELAFELLAVILESTNREDSTDEEILTQVDNIKKNDGLKECVLVGVGFIHEGLQQTNRDIVIDLFRSKKLPILIVTSQSAWTTHGLDCRLTIIAGTEYDDEGGSLTRRKEYKRTDLMKMIFGMRETSPQASVGKRSVVILTETVMKSYYKAQLIEPFALESQLSAWFADHLNAEIASGVVESKQDAVDYLTWTFFYRRLPKNANYYRMKGVTPMDISNHLSELVETSLTVLESSKCVAIEGEDDSALGPLNLGIIASHYYLKHATVEFFASFISASTDLKRVLDIVSHASEFDSVAVRNGEEEEILQEMGSRARIALESAGGPVSYSSTHAKVHLLLQAHMNREKLHGNLADDQKHIVKVTVELLRAMVDVISSGGWLKPAIAAIELCQMLVQAVWDSDSFLMQLPYMDRTRAELLKNDYDVTDIFGFVDMEDEQRNQALKGLSENQVSKIAGACQQFPFIDDIEIVDVSQQNAADDDEDDEGGATTTVVVSVKRTEDEEEDEDEGEGEGEEKNTAAKNAKAKAKVPPVSAPRFPQEREEGWWIIVGDEESNSVFTVKHFALKQDPLVKLEFASPTTPGEHNLKVSLMSDSYIDCDQEESFKVVIGPNNNVTDDENETGKAENSPDVIKSE